MNEPRRRAADTLQVVEGLLESQLGRTVEGRPLARLAATAAIDYSGAAWGTLFLDEGTGLEAVLTLRHDLETPADEEAVVDPEILRRVTSSGQVELDHERLAAPILLEGGLRGVLYLDGIEESAMGEAGNLAGAVAKRIASFLHSADLVDRVARQQKGLEELEKLGTTLGGPELRRRDFDNAAESARRGTASDIGVLVILGPQGALAAHSISGARATEIGPVVDNLARSLTPSGSAPHEPALGTHQLLEAFWADELTATGEEAERRAAGFVAVGRQADVAFEPGDRTFLRALAHLIGGAVGRERYFRRAAEDPVTETGSRLALHLGLAEARGRALATGRPFSVLLADIDDFKLVNDEYGHLVGDEVLRRVAEALRARLRTHDFVARFGGDEFVLILPETTAAEAARLAEKLRNLIAESTFSHHKIRLSLSIGVAVFSPEMADDSELLRRADRALYDSKTAGRNRVSVFS
ncbi:MAG: GGDEF domain-containing protein [Acidobacteriota bacterium]|nr:GGDEF domain-containing protein [Acidobacteriota bacterium]